MRIHFASSTQVIRLAVHAGTKDESRAKFADKRLRNLPLKIELLRLFQVWVENPSWTE
jgi:hypothetical protein